MREPTSDGWLVALLPDERAEGAGSLEIGGVDAEYAESLDGEGAAGVAAELV